MRYVVKFLHLQEQTVIENRYESLFDALKVAKETNIAPDRLHQEAMSDTQFNEELILLLDTGFVYTGTKSEAFPDGDMMIQLLRETTTGLEPVSTHPIMRTNYVVNPKH